MGLLYSAGRALLAAGAAFGLGGTGAAAEPISIDDLSRLPMIESLSLSPDGKKLVALIASRGEKSESPALSVWDLDNPSKAPVITEAGGNVEFMFAEALKGGKVLVYARSPYTGETYGCIESSGGVGRTYQEKLLFTGYDLKKFDDPFAIRGTLRGRSDATRRCLELASRGSVLTNLLTLDPEHVIVQEFDTTSFRVDYKRYNLATGATSLLFSDSAQQSADFLDPRDGQVWTRSSTQSSGGSYRVDVQVRDAQSGGFSVHQPLTTLFEERRTVVVVGRDEATGKFYVITDQFSDKTRAYFYDPASRAYDPEPLFAHNDFSVTGVLLGSHGSDFNRLLGFVYLADIPRVYWLDEELGGLAASVETAFPGMDVAITDFNEDRSRILVSVSRSDRPTRYFLLRDKAQLVPLGEAAPWIDTGKTSAAELVHYEARDGLRIPALLTPPSGWSRGDAPAKAVVLPHGGPWARDFARWDDWVQFFTSRGFVVLQPQYRGSTGWGHELWLAGDAEWGQKMQDDKDDGAMWLASQGYADPERMIIFGYSYGGYAAFAATAREGGPFKCAIAGAGVADLSRLSSAWSENRQQRLYQGRTVRGLNPIQNAGANPIPLLIFHGDRDVRVPISHSRSFFNRARSRQPTTFVEIKDMPHSFPWKASWRREVLGGIEKFLETDCRL